MANYPEMNGVGQGDGLTKRPGGNGTDLGNS